MQTSSYNSLDKDLLDKYNFTIVPKMKIVELANSKDPDEAAHNELPHQYLHCLLSVDDFFLNFADMNFVVFVG